MNEGAKKRIDQLATEIKQLIDQERCIDMKKAREYNELTFAFNLDKIDFKSNGL